MEENKGLEMGVEDTGVANLETEPVVNEEPTEQIEEVAETEVTETEVTETEPQPIESKFENAFSKRLSKATEKIRQEVSSEYEGKISRFQKVLEMGAKENGLESVDEYVDALLGEYEENTDKQNEKQFDPETMAILEELKEQRATQEMEAEKKSYWDKQARQLKEVGVTDLSQIPEEVIERALENDTEIAFEYLKWDKQQAIENAKKETIRKIQEQDSPGSLTGGGYGEGLSISELKWNDPKFEELKNKVLRGEIKNF